MIKIALAICFFLAGSIAIYRYKGLYDEAVVADELKDRQNPKFYW